MAIAPVCDRCGEELKRPGGLLFGPPNSANLSAKRHLCEDCYKSVRRAITRHRRFVSKNDEISNPGEGF